MTSSSVPEKEITYRTNELADCLKNPVRPRRCIYLATALRDLLDEGYSDPAAESLLEIFLSKPDLRVFAAKAIFDAESVSITLPEEIDELDP